MPIPLGRVIPIFGTNPAGDPELERALKMNIRVRRQKKNNTKPSSQVLTLESAFQAVEKVLSDGKIQKLGLFAAAKALQKIGVEGQNDVAQAICDELEKRTLSHLGQRSSFKTDEKLWKRPCRGHGYGRPENLRKGNE